MLFGGPNELTKESFYSAEGFFFPMCVLHTIWWWNYLKGSVPFKHWKLDLWLNFMTNQEQLCWHSVGPFNFQTVYVYKWMCVC